MEIKNLIGTVCVNRAVSEVVYTSTSEPPMPWIP